MHAFWVVRFFDFLFDHSPFGKFSNEFDYPSQCNPASNLYTCHPTFSDTSNCSVDPSGFGVCPCIEAPERTDCNEWGPVCHGNNDKCDATGSDGSCDVDADGNRVCVCVGDYHGPNCSQLPCDNNSERNDCDDSVNDMDSCFVNDAGRGTCYCKDDYPGRERTDCVAFQAKCGDDVRTCVDENTEYCTLDSFGEALCVCNTGFEGDNCETVWEPSSPSTPTPSTPTPSTETPVDCVGENCPVI